MKTDDEIFEDYCEELAQEFNTDYNHIVNNEELKNTLSFKTYCLKIRLSECWQIMVRDFKKFIGIK